MLDTGFGMAYAKNVMKKFVARFLGTLIGGALAFVMLACPWTSAHAQEAAGGEEQRLRFGPDGTFTVLLLADMQDTQFVSEYLTRSVEGVIRDYPADLIVLLGDQLEGASPVMRLGNDYENVKLALEKMLKPIADSGIPFAFVLGNHDYDAPVSVDVQLELYRAYENCIMAAEDSDAPGNNVFSLPIHASQGDDILLNLYFFDTGADLINGDYGAVDAEQVAWYEQHSQALRMENGYEPIPSVAFMHVPVAEIYELFQQTSVNQPGAAAGVGVGAGNYYQLPTADVFIGEAKEAPCPSSQNNGLFEGFLRQDDVFLSVSGHDHVNSFIGVVEGIDLLSAPGSTFTSYNDRSVRGARLLRFTEHNVQDYETVHVRYSDYDTADGIGVIPYYFSTTTAIPNVVKVGLVGLLLAVLAGLLIVSILRDNRSGPMPDMPNEDGDNEPPEDPYL